MIAAILIFLVVVVIIVAIGGGVAAAIEFQDIIFGAGILLVGVALILGGLFLLVKIGGPIGAIGIFIALFGGVFVWFGKSIIKDDL